MIREQQTSTQASPAREAVFQARGITKVYRMGEVASMRCGASTWICIRGEFLVLLGPSGSGKSTLSISSAASTYRPAARCSIWNTT